MDNNEALSHLKPHNSQKCISCYSKAGSKKNRMHSSFSKFIITILCLSNIIMTIFLWISKVKLNNSISAFNNINSLNVELSKERDNIASLHTDLQREIEKLKAENLEFQKELELLRNQNDELINENKELIEDNIQLQNSLKMAASVGIKPQNYTEFNEIVSRGEIDRGTYIGKFLGTAYTPSKEECGNDKGITHSGKPIIPGVSVAVDRNYWPFGTVFYIRGLGYAIAMDTGSGVKGKYRFDFAVFDKEFAKKLGNRYWDVYLVKLGNGKVDSISLY